MGNFAKGNRSLAISDRSGMQFPYNEMVREWNGSIVHYSEFEAKQPQLNPPYHKADAVALQRARPDVRPGSGCLVQLDPNYWPGQFLSNGMQPGISPLEMNISRQANIAIGTVEITTT
jgi:hypothetical protein